MRHKKIEDEIHQDPRVVGHGQRPHGDLPRPSADVHAAFKDREMIYERIVTIPCPARPEREPHDYRARHFADGTYHAICQHCQDDFGEVDFHGWDTIIGVGHFRAPDESA